MEGITPEQMEAIKQQCIFCQIADGRMASKKVYEDEKVVAVLDINPATTGHILVITKKHYFVMPQMPDEETEYIGKIAKQLSQVLLKALKVEGTTIFIANGAAAGQKAQHFMMHIIPRKENDQAGIKIDQKQIKPEDYKKIHEKLKQGIEKYFGKTAEHEEKKEIKEKKETQHKQEEKKEEPEPKKTEKQKEKPEPKKTKQEKNTEAPKKINLDEIAKMFGAKK